MKRTLVALAFVLFTSSFAASPQSTHKRKIACKTPENSSTCYWTHGRLSSYNGSPSLRLWKIGTGRLPAIYSGPGVGPFDDSPNDDDDLEPPFALETHNFLTSDVFGDFEVCPLAPEKDGHMQPVCIESVENIVTKKN